MIFSAISYYTYKFFSRARLKKLIIQNAIYSQYGLVKFIRELPFSGKIILFFGNARLIHYGDQLFFLPIVLLLKRLNFQIVIAQPGKLSNLWESYGFTVMNEIHWNFGNALWLSKDDMLPHIIHYVIKQDGHFVGFNFGKMKESQPISKLIASELIKIIKQLDINFHFENEELEIFFKTEFHSEININDDINKVAKWSSELDEFSTKNFLLFSDFLSSGFLQAIWRRKYLYNMAKELKSKYALIYIGSQKEKSLRKPSFINLDLRGETNPTDLFYLFNHPSVKGYIGFDTFPLHVATLSGKFLYVVKKSKVVDEKKFIPFIPNCQNLIKVIK